MELISASYINYSFEIKQLTYSKFKTAMSHVKCMK